MPGRWRHWVVVVSTNPESRWTGAKVPIPKLRGNKDQKARDSRDQVLEICPFKLVLAVVFACIVGLIPREREVYAFELWEATSSFPRLERLKDRGGAIPDRKDNLVRG